MRKHPKTFDPLFTNMIAAGEAGGILDTILKRLATYIEKAVKLKGQVKSAMIYPIAVIVIAGVVVGVILWKVIPTSRRCSRASAPSCRCRRASSSRSATASSRFVPFIIVGIGAVGFGVQAYYATDGGKRVIDGIMLKLPILGIIMRKIAVARFCRTLATLISSGVPILDGLEITARTAGNAVIEDAIMVDAHEHRARRNDFGAAEGDRRLPADGHADDRRRRGDRRARHDARRRSPTSTRKRSTRRSPAC